MKQLNFRHFNANSENNIWNSKFFYREKQKGSKKANIILFSISSSFRPFYENLFPKATEDSRKLPKSNEKVRPLPKNPPNTQQYFLRKQQTLKIVGKYSQLRSTKQLTGKEEMAWEIMQATCTQKYTVLDTVFTDWINRKVKTKNTWLLKYFKVLDCSTLFLLGRLSWLTKQVDPGDCGEGGEGWWCEWL